MIGALCQRYKTDIKKLIYSEDTDMLIHGFMKSNIIYLPSKGFIQVYDFWRIFTPAPIKQLLSNLPYLFGCDY